MPYFRKIPKVIEAFQFPPKYEDLPEEMRAFINKLPIHMGVRVAPGSWVLKHENGTYAVCSNDIFKQNYESV